MSEPRALITGVTGQDGSYLAELLLEKGYEVHGMVRRSSTENFERIAHLTPRLRLHQADLLDQSSLMSLLQAVRPAELYNLAAQSFVPTSWTQPSLTGEFTALGVTRMLEAVRLALEAILAQQEPYPAVVMDREWNLRRTNKAAERLFAWLAAGSPAAPPGRPTCCG
jgi:GDP-mannose 4,6-dehydratase